VSIIMWISISFIPNRDNLLDRIDSASSLLSRYTRVSSTLLCKYVLDVEPDKFTSKRIILCAQDEHILNSLVCLFTVESIDTSPSSQDCLEQNLANILYPTIPPIPQDNLSAGNTYMVHIDPTKVNTHQV